MSELGLPKDGDAFDLLMCPAPRKVNQNCTACPGIFVTNYNLSGSLLTEHIWVFKSQAGIFLFVFRKGR